MSKIIAIGTATPGYQTSQDDILGFMHKAYDAEEASRKLKALFRFSGIRNRYSVLPDFNLNLKKHTLFNGSSQRPEVDARLDVFKDNALPLAKRAIIEAFAKVNSSIKAWGVTHLITVTCTGMYAPGLDAELIEELDLPSDTSHTAVNFLGCNAAFHALKMGDYICRSEPDARVLIVCVELCTLHFQPKDNSDNLLSNTLFGDGAAALLMSSDKQEIDSNSPFLTINGFYSLLLIKGKDLMGWNITPLNFEMILNEEIPNLIGEEVNGLLSSIGQKLKINSSQIDKYAVHPGGKKILDTVKRKLDLNDEDLSISYQVLEEYGNMSSPTILFILEQFMKLPGKENEKILAVGFGPGLSIQSAVLTYG